MRTYSTHRPVQAVRHRARLETEGTMECYKYQIVKMLEMITEPGKMRAAYEIIHALFLTWGRKDSPDEKPDEESRAYEDVAIRLIRSASKGKKKLIYEILMQMEG